MNPKINYKSVDELVYDKIKSMILNNHLKPGTKIIQHKLAEELGVSRTPVRRALTQMVKEHLVRVAPRGRFYVRDFSIAEMVTIFEMREVLEGLACRKAALKVSKKKLDYFGDLYRKALELAEKDGWESYRKVDEKFHTFLIEVSGVELLKEIVKSFQILSNSYTPGLIRPPQETFPEHMAIIKALKSRNPELSEKLMREHLQKSAKVLEKRLISKSGKENPEKF